LKQVELFVLECNKEGMKCLRKSILLQSLEDNRLIDDLKTSLDLLKKAERVLFEEYRHTRNEIIYRLIGITLNNLGCYYKK